jgi:hypothetical protein
MWGTVRIAYIMHIQHDTWNQPYIEWQAGSPEVIRRAWITRRRHENDGAGTERYLKIAPMNPSKKEALAALPTIFPIFSRLADEQILEAFVATVGTVTGCRIP